MPQSGDYLEPFAAPPALPPNVASSVTTGTLDFTATGHVLFGDDERMAAAAGDFLLIDRGSDRGVAPGARFAIYRAVRHYIPDLRGLPAPHLPLASVGEATVVSASQSWSVIQVAGARDAVQAGDFVVPRK